MSEDGDLYYFSEEKYISEKPDEFDEQRRELLRETPTIDNIYECKFIRFIIIIHY